MKQDTQILYKEQGLLGQPTGKPYEPSVQNRHVSVIDVIYDDCDDDYDDECDDYDDDDDDDVDDDDDDDDDDDGDDDDDFLKWWRMMSLL